ncbi:hypothetical protein CSAL01_13597 [Colletotrichum salicis]|uniref:Uncharacterized protein n=1 Tax=Colletotrichum salicis TaxID=1209931 RepID=A0A135RUT9_9PEZI|nr:hypothetical protein CSAL01_13597 [Colletotrichum salicis]
MSTSATASTNAYALMGAPRLCVSTQIANALLVAITPAFTIDDLPQIVVGLKRYVLETQLSRRRGRGRSSWIRDHGDFLVEVIQGRSGTSFWSYRRCDAKGAPRVFGAVTTSAAQEHLLRISATSDEDSDGSYPPFSATASPSSPFKRVRLINTSILKAKITTMRDLCVASVVSAGLPFIHFENAFLQQIFRYHSTEVAGEVPWGRTAIRDHLGDLLRHGEALMKSELRRAASKIYLLFDL